MQLCTEDHSKRALTKCTGENKVPVNCEGTNMEAPSIHVEDGGERLTSLDAIEVQLSSDENSKERFLEIINERKETAARCGKTSTDHSTNKDDEDMACSSKVKYENVNPENVEDENKIGRDDCHGDGPHDDDFSGKDLLRFAWQIARGMVSSHSVTRTAAIDMIIICICYLSFLSNQLSYIHRGHYMSTEDTN